MIISAFRGRTVCKEQCKLLKSVTVGSAMRTKSAGLCLIDRLMGTWGYAALGLVRHVPVRDGDPRSVSYMLAVGSIFVEPLC